MKDNLFELLLHLFEQSLTQIQKNYPSQDSDSLELSDDDSEDIAYDNRLYIQSAKTTSTRIMTYDEQMRLTKASYQFLMRIKLWGIIDTDLFELVMNELSCLDSRIITLEETKWVLRTLLAEQISDKQLTFLDLVLHCSENQLTVH